MNKTAWGLLAVRLILGGSFTVAGLLKVSDPVAFADAIATFHIVPGRLIPALAVSLPFLEILIGVMLLTGWQKRCAAFAAVVLLTAYTGALAAGLVRHLPLECDCFGATTSAQLALMRDGLLLTGAMVLYTMEVNHRWKTSS